MTTPLSGQLASFAEQLPFALDDFQQRACQALENGHGVLVCAPTGAGKTVVGEFAVHLALAAGRKCFYTTPIKALSNQKHNDLVARYGPERIGLLTGDQSINGDADVVVMTTEVLRNMLYANSPALYGLSHVVMDEVHFLADRMRGAVWEEVILHLPDEVRLDGEQCRGVRRLDSDRARRHHCRRRRTPPSSVVAARDGRQAAFRPVRLPSVGSGEVRP
jgi:ATP-dependent RNA helicase HelY